MQAARSLRATLVAAATVIAGPVAPAGASAAPPPQPGCGDVITQSVRLRANVNCPQSNGLTVAGDGVVLDLGGHSVTGYPFRGSIGIHVTGDDVTVRGGTVNASIALLGDGDRLRVADADLSGHSGLVVSGAAPRVARVVVSNGEGSRLTGAGGRVTDSRFDSGGGDDALIVHGPRAVVARTVVTGGTGAFFPVGIIVVSADQSRVVDNIVTNATPTSLALPGPGIDVAGAGPIVARNRVTVANGTGISVAGTGARVSGNEASGNSGDGIAVSASSSVVRRNVTDDNGGDGLRVTGPGALVARNVARSNGALGIEAIAGTLDGGGNRASGNGDPRQCVGVACRP